MFDRIYLTVKCPNCGEEEMRECQTKDLESLLHTYHKGDNIATVLDNDQVNEITAVCNCHSKKCIDSESFYDGMSGPLLYLKIKLNAGIITGEYEVVMTDQ